MSETALYIETEGGNDNVEEVATEVWPARKLPFTCEDVEALVKATKMTVGFLGTGVAREAVWDALEPFKREKTP